MKVQLAKISDVLVVLVWVGAWGSLTSCGEADPSPTAPSATTTSSGTNETGTTNTESGSSNSSGSSGHPNCSSALADYPAGVTDAPVLTFYFESGGNPTALSSGNKSSFLANVSNAGCGPFGVWEAGTYPSGEVATEIEMRKSAREKVYAMAPGVVALVQASTSPMESGEVEGVWVRYGANYIVKYTHVHNPVVTAGAHVAAGDVIGETVSMSNGTMYFFETEVRKKSEGALYAIPWNTLLASDNQTAFNSLFGSGNCTAPSVIGIDGLTTTASNWKNDAVTQVDVTKQDQACAFNW